MVLNLYYALHFVIKMFNYAGVNNNIVDITVQIAPNKDYVKSRPASHKTYSINVFALHFLAYHRYVKI